MMVCQCRILTSIHESVPGAKLSRPVASTTCFAMTAGRPSGCYVTNVTGSTTFQGFTAASAVTVMQ